MLSSIDFEIRCCAVWADWFTVWHTLSKFSAHGRRKDTAKAAVGSRRAEVKPASIDGVARCARWHTSIRFDAVEALCMIFSDLRFTVHQVLEECVDLDSRSDGQKRGSGPLGFPMHARGPPAAFRPTFLLALMRAEPKTNKNKVAEQRNFLCGAAC